jgi:hypothetical protein
MPDVLVVELRKIMGIYGTGGSLINVVAGCKGEDGGKETMMFEPL